MRCPAFRRCEDAKTRPEDDPFDTLKNKFAEFKKSECFKNIFGTIFGTNVNQDKETQEKTSNEASEFYSKLPQDVKESVSVHYNNLPQGVKDNLNHLLGGLPEKVLNKECHPCEEPEKRPEVEIVEEPVHKVAEPECEAKPQEPLIQEIPAEKIEEVEPKVEEPKVEEPKVEEPKVEEPKVDKVYPHDVVEKARLLKDLFPDSDIDKLLEFVSQAPQVGIEELVESYLSL
jgi:cation transport regulator ChaB